MGHHDPDSIPAMDKAMDLLKRGQAAEAEGVLQRAIEVTRRDHGVDSLPHASALNDLGNFLMAVGQTEGAIQALQEACRYEFPNHEQGTRERLTYLWNLGEALKRNGQLSEAEDAIRLSVQGRERFYGREHAGFAFGLMPLAQVLLEQGRLPEAEQVILEVVDNFHLNRHPWLLRAIAVRAEILKARRADYPVFADVQSLPDEQIAELAQNVIERISVSEPRLVRPVLDDLLELLLQRFGETNLWTLQTLTWIANLERSLGNHAVRQQSIRRVISACDSMGDQAQALEACQGLALAISEAGTPEAAIPVYREALTRSDEMGDPASQSQVRRNFGLMLAENDQRDEAEQLMREAVHFANRAGDIEKQGEAEIALGIFLQHGGHLEEAKELLSRGIPSLDSAHPHALMGRSHLNAIESGGSCGCGDMSQAAVDAFCEILREQVPEDLLEEVQIEMVDGEMKVQVRLKREPSQEEQEMLTRAMRHAQHQFQERLRRGS